MKPIPIPHVSTVIVSCWMEAEQSSRSTIREKYFDSSEEEITSLFRGELRDAVAKAADRGDVERAFLLDLKTAFRAADLSKLHDIARGLTATVSFHSRPVEAKTGGDFGVVVVRPDARAKGWANDEFGVVGEHKRGLLCQAKLFGRDSRWNGLTRPQRKELPARLGYFALLLYRYSDQDERRELNPFIWQLADQASITDVEQWLSADAFPDCRASTDILESLFRGRIGTDDKNLIETVIAPPQRETLVIRIHWPDETGPPKGSIRVVKSEQARVEQQISVRR